MNEIIHTLGHCLIALLAFWFGIWFGKRQTQNSYPKTVSFNEKEEK